MKQISKGEFDYRKENSMKKYLFTLIAMGLTPTIFFCAWLFQEGVTNADDAISEMLESLRGESNVYVGYGIGGGKLGIIHASSLHHNPPTLSRLSQGKYVIVYDQNVGVKEAHVVMIKSKDLHLNYFNRPCKVDGIIKGVQIEIYDNFSVPMDTEFEFLIAGELI